MINAVLDIKLLAPDEWQVLRTIRLRALRESPRAFTSHHAAEARWSEHQWRQRLTTSAWVVAIERGEIIGVAGLVEGELPHEERHVESIWVAPTHRCRGVFRSLLAAVAELGRQLRLRELPLWVLEDNETARHAYERLGFIPTGERQPIGPAQARFERRLRLVI